MDISKNTTQDEIKISESNKVEQREVFEMWAWHEVEIQLEDYHKDGNNRHLMTAAVMAVIAFEAFLNNIVEFYRPDVEFECFDEERGFLKRFKKGIKLLDPEIDFNGIKSWGQFNQLIILRNQIVHKRTKSTIYQSDEIGNLKLVHDNLHRIDWSKAEEKIMSIKSFVEELRDIFIWNSIRLEGGLSGNHIKERFDHFFVFVKSAEEMEVVA